MEGPDSPAVSASQGGSCNDPRPCSSSPGAVRSLGSPHALAAHDVDRVHEKCSSCDHSASFFEVLVGHHLPSLPSVPANTKLLVDLTGCMTSEL